MIQEMGTTSPNLVQYIRETSMAYLDSILLARGSVDTPFAGGVGTVAKNVLLDVVVVKNGGGLNGKGGAHLCRGRRRRGRERGREKEGELRFYVFPRVHVHTIIH